MEPSRAAKSNATAKHTLDSGLSSSFGKANANMAGNLALQADSGGGELRRNTDSMCSAREVVVVKVFGAA